MGRLILDLCGGTGSWSQPYRVDPEYEVYIIDPHATGKGSIRQDVRLWELSGAPVHGILAAPPCTTFSIAGARYWDAKGKKDVLRNLSVVDACMRIILTYGPVWWALENPIGRLHHWLLDPKYVFHPWQYGDNYTKRTALWGNFTIPPPTVLQKPEQMESNILEDDVAGIRSITPTGFARAFKEANP